MAVLPVAAGGGHLTQVDLRVEVGGKSIAVVAAVAVQDINGVDGVELVLFGVGAVSLGHARVKAAAQQSGQAGLLELFCIGPLPAVIKVGGEAGLLAALLVNSAPGGIVGILRLVVGGIHIVDTALQAGIHDGQILVRQGDIHHQIRLVAVDQGHQFLHLVCIHLCGGDLGGGQGGQLFGQGVALGLGAAGDAQFGEHLRGLAAFLDGDRGDTAAANDENSAHDSTLLFSMRV